MVERSKCFRVREPGLKSYLHSVILGKLPNLSEPCSSIISEKEKVLATS